MLKRADRPGGGKERAPPRGKSDEKESQRNSGKWERRAQATDGLQRAPPHRAGAHQGGRSPGGEGGFGLGKKLHALGGAGQRRAPPPPPAALAARARCLPPHTAKRLRRRPQRQAGHQNSPHGRRMGAAGGAPHWRPPPRTPGRRRSRTQLMARTNEMGSTIQTELLWLVLHGGAAVSPRGREPAPRLQASAPAAASGRKNCPTRCGPRAAPAHVTLAAPIRAAMKTPAPRRWPSCLPQPPHTEQSWLMRVGWRSLRMALDSICLMRSRVTCAAGAAWAAGGSGGPSHAVGDPGPCQRCKAGAVTGEEGGGEVGA